MSNYGKLPLWLSITILLLFSLYLGLYFGLFGYLTRFITTKTALPLPFITPLLWVSLEYLRAHLLTGFPWVSLGYSQYKFLSIIQIADITSFLGISFLIVGVNTVLFEILLYVKDRASLSLSSIIAISSVFLLFVLSLAYGHFKLQTSPQTSHDQSGNMIKATVIQGNIPQDLKWDKNFQRNTIDVYKHLTDEANKDSVNLVIWPETAAPFFFQDRSGYQRELFDLAKKENIFLLFGSPSYAMTSNSTPRLFNSAYLISPNGEKLSRYDKIHLVPFGEYVPLSKILFFIEKMVMGIGDFEPGKDYTLHQIPQGKFGVVICFEVIFPDLVRRFVENGAEFMTTITNDAWFGESAAPYQHFAMVVFRAIENRVYFARAANTGISGFINPKGEILEASPIFVESYLTHRISLSTVKTFYTLYGDVFAYVCLSLTGIMLILALLNQRLKIKMQNDKSKIKI